MKIGMLWFDKSNRSVEERVGEAASYYEAKYQDKPDHCVMNSSESATDGGSMSGMTVEKSDRVNRWHFWIGKKDR